MRTNSNTLVKLKIPGLKKNDKFIFQSTSLENDFNTLYNAKNIKIIGNIGKHPLIGFTFSRLYKAIISC